MYIYMYATIPHNACLGRWYTTFVLGKKSLCLMLTWTRPLTTIGSKYSCYCILFIRQDVMLVEEWEFAIGYF